MQIRDLSQPITSKTLNESLAKNFGYKLKLDRFSDVQLEDARNKLRTKLSQFEVTESFDSVIESQEYRKTKMFLDVINQEILEREETADERTAIEESRLDRMRNRALEHSVPESWINSAIKRIKLGESDNSELSAELRLRYDVSPSAADWILLEGETDKAEVVMMTKDMVDQITGWLEDVAAMRTEQLLELLDSIKEQQGSDVAQRYNDAMRTALDGLYSALETSRNGVNEALSIVTGQVPDTLGAPVSALGAAPGGKDLGAMPGEGPELGAEPAGELPPPAAEAGRAKRESIEYSRRLSMMLNSKKK